MPYHYLLWLAREVSLSHISISLGNTQSEHHRNFFRILQGYRVEALPLTPLERLEWALVIYLMIA